MGGIVETCEFSGLPLVIRAGTSRSGRSALRRNAIVKCNFLRYGVWAAVVEYFFADVAAQTSATGDDESIFADGLNVFKPFDRHFPVAEANANLNAAPPQPDVTLRRLIYYASV